VQQETASAETLKHVAHALAGWLLPGAGHLLRGEWAKGLVLGVTLLGCFAAGEYMSEFHAVSRREHEISFWAQIGVGGPTLLCAWYDETHNGPWAALAHKPMPVPRLLDCGIMYTCVAGLLTFVLVVDLLFPLIRKKEPAGEPQTEEAAP